MFRRNIFFSAICVFLLISPTLAQALEAEMLLGRLGYIVKSPFNGVLDEDERAALRLYQRHRGLPITGDPSSRETINQMHSDREILNYQPIQLPSFSVGTMFWGDFVLAEGTWKIEKGELVTNESERLVQTSEISCNKSRGTCFEYTGVLYNPAGNRMLVPEMTTYEIDVWDQEKIFTKPDRATCQAWYLYIGRAKKEVKKIARREFVPSNKDLCLKEISQEIRVFRLSEGSKLYLDALHKWEKESRQLMQIQRSR